MHCNLIGRTLQGAVHNFHVRFLPDPFLVVKGAGPQTTGPWAATGKKVVKILNSGKHYSNCLYKQSAYWQVCYRRLGANS